ncbi:MAG: thermonuclease family protein [Candidatus Krumholzibacteriia bacterium]
MSRLPVLRPLILAVAILSAASAATAQTDRTQNRPSLVRIAVDPRLIDVGDGDTVVINWTDDDRERVRILGIDTPEVAHPGYGMPYDQPFGPEAAAFAAGAFAAGTEIELVRAAETDTYGRTLGYFSINGRNYSVLAIAAGFAVETVSHYGDNGLPEQAEAVLAATRQAAPVPFEPPYQFRRRLRELADWREAHPER